MLCLGLQKLQRFPKSTLDFATTCTYATIDRIYHDTFSARVHSYAMSENYIINSCFIIKAAQHGWQRHNDQVPETFYDAYQTASPQKFDSISGPKCRSKVISIKRQSEKSEIDY